MAQEIAGYVAEYKSPDQPTLCYGYGDTLRACARSVDYQISGAPAEMKCRIRMRVYPRAVDADEASEIAEMLNTPW